MQSREASCCAHSTALLADDDERAVPLLDPHCGDRLRDRRVRGHHAGRRALHRVVRATSRHSIAFASSNTPSFLLFISLFTAFVPICRIGSPIII